ncbi:MAG: FtsQ-type POTRA domain-containing protein [Clostridiales bacterium]|jgi:cell division protein FtsQ|nr:FtsQ-type POTRA domain-containing protein [Clostridiales bacterium]
MKRTSKKKKSFVVLFLFALLAFTAVAVLISPLFEIRQIEVVGNSTIATEDILGRAQLETGQNMLAFSANVVRAQINQLPFVSQVDVVREFPDRVIITVRERVPVANIRVAHSATYLLIDDGGMVLESGSTSAPALPVAIGVDFANFAVGEYLEVENDLVFRDMLRLYRLFTRYDFFPKTVDMSNPADIVFYTDNLSIFFGSMSDMDRKIQYISAIKARFSPEARGFIEIRDINERPRFGLIR